MIKQKDRYMIKKCNPFEIFTIIQLNFWQAWSNHWITKGFEALETVLKGKYAFNPIPSTSSQHITSTTTHSRGIGLSTISYTIYQKQR